MGYEKTFYFELLELFEKNKSAKGISKENPIFIDVRRELINRYSKHSEAYKFWLGRVYKERKKILQEALSLFDKKVRAGRYDINDLDKHLEAYVHKGVYDIYSTHVGQKMAQPLATRQFIQALSQIEGNSLKFKIFPQNKILNLDKHATPMRKYLINFSQYERRLADNFAYHVHPKGAVARRKIKERAKLDNRLKIDNSRITLRLVPAKAVEVFKKVAIEIVGSSDSKWETVFSSKIMGPQKLPKSVDSMIIYVNSRERQIIKDIVDFLTTNFPAKTYFRPGGPMGMFELSQGITYADSSDPKKGKSFGASRGKSIEANLATLFLEARKDPNKSVSDIANSISEHMLHTGSFKSMHTANLEYSMPAFRRPFSSMAVDPFAHHIRK